MTDTSLETELDEILTKTFSSLKSRLSKCIQKHEKRVLKDYKTSKKPLDSQPQKKHEKYEKPEKNEKLVQKQKRKNHPPSSSYSESD